MESSGKVVVEESQHQSSLEISDKAQMIYMEGSSKKLYKCKVCEHVSPFYSKFISHYRIHSGEKPFGCPYCPYRGSLKHHVTTHLKHVHKLPSQPI